MLEELLRVLKPGGQAYVSVWATLQEDPAKTLAKWEPMQTPASPSPPPKPAPPSDTSPSSRPVSSLAQPDQAIQEHDVQLEQHRFQAADNGNVTIGTSCHQNACEAGSPASGIAAVAPDQEACVPSLPRVQDCSITHEDAEQKSVQEVLGSDAGGQASLQQLPSAAQPGSRDDTPGAGCSNDYFVPWHLPLHRAQATGLLQSIPGAPDWARPKSSQACPGGMQPTAASGGGLDVTPDQLRGVRFDEQKQTLVFRRYYHLFEEGELPELVSNIQGAHVADCFYDKSNWCVVMSKAV